MLPSVASEVCAAFFFFLSCGLVILRFCMPCSSYGYYVGHGVKPSGAINVIADERGPFSWKHGCVHVMIVKPDEMTREGVSLFVL